MPPTIEDAVSDLDRLNRGLKQQGCDIEKLNVGLTVMRQLAAVMRENQRKNRHPGFERSRMPIPAGKSDGGYGDLYPMGSFLNRPP